MWRTPQGERVLVGAEAELIRDAIAYMADLLHDEADGLRDEWTCGVQLFDELSWQQRLALLNRVAKALFREDVPAPELSAVNEATIGAVFAHIRDLLEIELDEDESTYWRERIAACQAPASGGVLNVVETCTDIDEWDALLECLSDGILWDGDWDMPDLFQDVDPDLSRVRRRKLGIVPNYFIEPAPDPREDELAEMFADLRRLAARS